MEQKDSKITKVSKNLLSALFGMATVVAECNEYEWDDKVCREELKRTQEAALEYLKGEIDWENLTNEDCDTLAFGKWDKESGLRLIPLYLRPIVPLEMEFASISGEKVKGKDFDNDHRFGCLAYGVIPNN